MVTFGFLPLSGKGRPVFVVHALIVDVLRQKIEESNVTIIKRHVLGKLRGRYPCQWRDRGFVAAIRLWDYLLFYTQLFLVVHHWGSVSAVALSLNFKNNAFCSVSLVWGFVEKRDLSHLKTPKSVAMETKVCHMIHLWKSFQKNVLVGRYYKRKMVFKRRHSLPPLPQEQKKKKEIK